MTKQRNIVDRMIGLEEKREFREFEDRAKNLGPDYYIMTRRCSSWTSLP